MSNRRSRLLAHARSSSHTAKRFRGRSRRSRGEAHLVALLFAVASAALGGCHFDLGSCDSTDGKSGRATFSYVGCRPVGSNAMAAGGAKSTINVDKASFTSVQSSAPDVATFALGSGSSVSVTAGNPGTTDLILLNDSAEVDRVSVRVAATTELAFNKGWGSDVGPTVVAGPSEAWHVDTRENGVSLVGTGAVKFTVTDPLTIGTMGGLGDLVTFTPTKAGAGRVNATSINATASVTVTIIDATAVDSFAASPAQASAPVNQDATVTVTASAAGKPVYFGDCTWKVSGGSIQITDQRKDDGISAPPAIPYHFRATTAGHYSATCDGGFGRSVTVTFDAQ